MPQPSGTALNSWAARTWRKRCYSSTLCVSDKLRQTCCSCVTRSCPCSLSRQDLGVSESGRKRTGLHGWRVAGSCYSELGVEVMDSLILQTARREFPAKLWSFAQVRGARGEKLVVSTSSCLQLVFTCCTKNMRLASNVQNMCERH